MEARCFSTSFWFRVIYSGFRVVIRQHCLWAVADHSLKITFQHHLPLLACSDCQYTLSDKVKLARISVASLGFPSSLRAKSTQEVSRMDSLRKKSDSLVCLSITMQVLEMLLNVTSLLRKFYKVCWIIHWLNICYFITSALYCFPL